MILLDCMDNVKFISVINKVYDNFSYTYIIFNNKLFDKYNKMNKYFKKIYLFFLKKMLNIDKLVKNCYNSNSKFITSINLDNNINLKEFILSNFFRGNNFNEITFKETIIKNSIKYFSNFDYSKKVVLITDKKFDIDIIKLYIDKFKTFDIVYINNKYDVKFLNDINNLNIEYGTSIKFVKLEDLIEYDVCLLNKRVDLSKYKDLYILDLTTSENDVYSNLYHEYLKFKKYIINEENFSKNKIGNLITRVYNNI